MNRKFIKRLFDFVGSAVLLLFLMPLLLFLAVAIRLLMGRPVFFIHERAGLAGKPFNLIKFRTMSNVCCGDGDPLPDFKRISRFGRFLRHSSLDELPELWNVLLGQMSLVGPRPLLVEYLPLYDSEQQRRHDVKPGLTGWAQVNGRNNISWEKKFQLDVWYVDNWTFVLDLKILFFTFGKVIKREGIDSLDDVSMPKFKGENH
jgi:sugar transferase EpsL